MDETKLNELTARLAEQEQAKVSLEAKLAEKDAKLTDMERQLADLHAQRRVDDVDRAIARLSEPVDGVALPIPALVDAGLRDLALLLHGGRVQLSEGKSPLGLLGDVLAQVRKSGVVRVVPQLQMSEGDGDDPAKAAYESAGGESLGITLDEWRAGAAAFDGGVK